MITDHTSGITNLLIDKDCPIASVYISLDTSTPDAREANRIRLQNAIQQLEASIADNEGIDEPTGKAIVSTLEATIDADDRWDLHGATLAIALTPDTAICHYLPHKVDDRIVLGDRFYILPSIRAAHDEININVIHLDKDHAELITLHGGSQSTITLSKDGVSGMPPAEHDRSDQLQVHSTGVAGGQPTAMFHGQGQAEHAAEERLRRWVKEIADIIADRLGDSDFPLVFAGPEELFGLYRQENSYSHFIDDTHINADQKDGLDDATREEVHQITSELREKKADAVRSAVLSAIDHDKGSSDISALCDAAEQGRIEHLMFVDTLDASAGGHLLRTGLNEDEAALNKIVGNTLKMGGVVACVDSEWLPNESVAAASFRY